MCKVRFGIAGVLWVQDFSILELPRSLTLDMACPLFL